MRGTKAEGLRSRVQALLLLPVFFLLVSCAAQQVKTMETTAYCGCGKCCNWERGSWKYLKLDFWNRYISAGDRKGQAYSGLTADGSKPNESSPGLFSVDTVIHPWMLPFRLVFPWLWLPEYGTIAADTCYYPFGTLMHVPGYGWGRVEDRGGAIKGPRRLDLYFDSHNHALQWGRQTKEVVIEKP
ncbi:MAG: 3D domain-containing protein [Thermodesulfobacteriota bacterium]